MDREADGQIVLEQYPVVLSCACGRAIGVWLSYVTGLMNGLFLFSFYRESLSK